MDNGFVVNGLSLPKLLIDLLQNGKWQHPGEEVIRSVIPFLHDPVIIRSLDGMRFDSSGHLADNPDDSALFHEVRGSKHQGVVELPWLDVEQAVLIAVNLEIG